LSPCAGQNHPRPTIWIIRIAFFDIAGTVAQYPHRPGRIGIGIKPVPVTADVLNHHHRIIYSRPIDVFTYQRAAAAVPFSESRIESSSDPENQHPSKTQQTPHFISFRISNIFQSSRFAPIIPRRFRPASHFPNFCLFFTKLQNPIPFLDNSAAQNPAKPFYFHPYFSLLILSQTAAPPARKKV